MFITKIKRKLILKSFYNHCDILMTKVVYAASMGSFNEAKICDLIGLFLMNKI